MNTSQAIQRSVPIIALALAVGGGYAAAQGKTAPAASTGQRTISAPSAMESKKTACPMHDAAAIADVTVEDTADGAVIRLTAKKPGDAQRVQELASRIAEHVTGGGMGGGGMMRRGTHGEGSMRGMGGRPGMKHERRGSTPKPAAEPSNQHNH